MHAKDRNLMEKYSIKIIWSSEDQAYLAKIIELPECIADGQTQEEALANAKVIMSEWIETATEDGREIPKALTI